MLVVIDTNILVSALWSKNGLPAKILSMVVSGVFVPCFDDRILCEYKDVLNRPKFKFSPVEVQWLLDWVVANGCSIVAAPIDSPFIDETDKKFYEVAKFCDAKLITGNIKHFPVDGIAITVSDFLKSFPL